MVTRIQAHMIRLRPRIIALVTIITCAPGPITLARAVPYTIIRAGSGMSAAIGDLDQSYQETSNGAVLDKETGPIPMISFGASSVSSNPQGGLYWRIQGRSARGNTTYNGQTLGGTPVQTTTANTIFDINGRLGVATGIGRHMALMPYFEMGEHDWRRNVGSGQGAGGIEHYTNGYLGGGLLWEIALNRRWVVAVRGMAGYTFGAQITATDPVFVNTSTNQISYATSSQTLGDSAYESGGLKATYLIDRMWRAFIRIDAVHFRYGASTPIPIFTSSGSGEPGFYEPDSQTTQIAVTVGSGARF